MFGKGQILLAGLSVCGALCAQMPKLSEPVTNVVFTVFDTETTGVDRKHDRIVEIGVVKFRGNGEILAATNWLVNPQIPIPPEAERIHGITTAAVRNAPTFDQVFPMFGTFCEGTVLLAHNAPFDVGFMRAELKRFRMDAPPLPVLDTLPLFRKWFPNAMSHALEPLSRYLGLQGDTYHRAEADSFYVVDIFRFGMKHRSNLQMKSLEREAGGTEWLDGRKH